ncbi:MAG: hypothetical protein NWQ55_09205 [Salibacteraceae bacterium]|jgi:hypothetical protein|nr:hypothetical protein [Salibacteraceae bacterium]
MKTLIGFAIIALISTSCASKYVLNTGTINKYQISNDDLTKIQFYNSQDIVLTRYENIAQDKKTEKGTLSLSTGKELDQVVIKADTPGKVVKKLENSSIAVSFEPDDNKYLIFGTSSASDTYKLQAISWKDGRGKINYGGMTYFTNVGSEHCFVSFKLKREYREDKKLRYAKGNKI